MEKNRFVGRRVNFPASHLAGAQFSHSNKETDSITCKQMETHKCTVFEDEAQAAWTLVSGGRSAEVGGAAPAVPQHGGRSEDSAAKISPAC